MGEIGETDDRAAADAKSFLEEMLYVRHHLQGRREHDVVETPVRELGQADVQVLVDRIDAMLHGCGNQWCAHLDAAEPGCAPGLEPGQARPLAAA